MSAQFNLKVGYNGGFGDPEFFNTILEDYNAERPWLDKTYDDLDYLQGLQLGVRYRFGPAAVDFTWHNRFKRFEAEGIDPSTNSEYIREVNLQLSSYAIGIESFIGEFSYGASFDVDRLNIKTEKTGRNDRFTVEDQLGIGSHFFVSYTIEASPFLYFSIRPYAQIPWSKFDLSKLSDELNPGTDYDDYQEDFMNFGVMFIFFNGE